VPRAKKTPIDPVAATIPPAPEPKPAPAKPGKPGKPASEGAVPWSALAEPASVPTLVPSLAPKARQPSVEPFCQVFRAAHVQLTGYNGVLSVGKTLRESHYLPRDWDTIIRHEEELDLRPRPSALRAEAKAKADKAAAVDTSDADGVENE